MIVIKTVFFTVCFTAALLILGDCFLQLLSWKKTISAACSWGFILLLSAFQLICYPLYRFGASFTLLFHLFSLLMGILLLLCLISIIRQKNADKMPCFQGIHSGWSEMGKELILAFVLILTIGFYFFMGEGFYYSSSDDGYNLPRAMEAIVQDTLIINDHMAWHGFGNGAICSFDNASTYYYFIAYLSVLFRIHPAVFYKTVFLFALLLLHLAAVSTAYDAVNTDMSKSKKALFFVFYILFQLLCVKPSTAGTWMTGYLYEGKAIVIAVIFPLILAACSNLICNVEQLKGKEWLSLSVSLLAGIELSVIGINLPVILYFCYGLAFLIGTKFRFFKKIWLPAILSVLPVIVFVFIVAKDAFTLFSGVGANTAMSSSAVIPDAIQNNLSQRTVIWKNNFLEGIDFWQFVLFCISAIYFLLRGNKAQRILFFGAPFILFFTFLNPLLLGPVSKYVTTDIVYWRLWWLLPIYLAPALALADLGDRWTQGKPQNAILLMIVTLGIVSGFEIFRTSIVATEYTIVPYIENVGRLFHLRPELRMNAYNLNAGPFETAKAIEADWDGESRPKVLMGFNRPFELRQYSAEIAVINEVRNYDQLEGFVEGTDIPLSIFVQTYSSMTDGKLLKQILDQMEADYVCFEENPAIRNLEDFGFRHVQDFGGIDLWRVE